MAAAKIQESSSSHRCTYHVFLSFRGADTRKNFTDHLYTALVRAGIHTFRDDDEIRRGENIETEIKTAIEESKISVVVLSNDYASSRWCLDELAMIMERRRSVGHVVMPVFYDVDTLQVKDQTGSYGEAFSEHQKWFKGDMCRVEEWRKALREVAELGGKVLQDRYQSQVIQNIVKEIGSKLNRTMLNVSPYLVGVDSRVAHINTWLQDGSNDISIATIYGVGGIGKTTIAKIVYNWNYDKFESGSFLANIRETSEQHNGIIRLQRQLLSDILRGKANKIYNADEGIIKIRDAICCRKILLVLDDVDQLDQYNAIIGMKGWLYPGSKVIITTRHERLLKAHEVNKMFRITELDEKESLQLFSWHAFGQDHPIEGYIEHSEKAVHLCCGIPLALQVLGSSLSGKTVDVWESSLQKLKAIPDSKIQKILKVSYDSLPDDHDKSLFLDIACFFFGMDEDYVVTILDGCGFYTVAGIHTLIDRCLVTISKEKKLMMHQLLRDMGKEIVRQESPEHPGKRSRLWRDKDAFAVLRENTGTEKVKGLILNLQMLKNNNTSVINGKRCHYKDFFSKPEFLHQANSSKRHRLGLLSWQAVNSRSANSFDEMNLKTKAFSKMDKLKLLQLNYVELTGNYGDFPKSLVWLFWRGSPLKCIPNDFPLEKLVVLDMRYSSLTNGWKGQRFLVKLKILNLSHCHGLVRTPGFTGLCFLERLKLKGCINLVEVDESIGNLQRLLELNLKDCKSLKKLPENISTLESLKKLVLSGCSKLDQLPEELWQIKSLRLHRLEGAATNQLHAVNASWYSTVQSWFLPKNPQSITFSLAILPCSLVDLYLADCNLSDVAIPNDLSCLRCLEYLDLRGNPLFRLPESINGISTLQYLCLDRCSNLQSLPELPGSLGELKAEGCTSLTRIKNLPNLHRALIAELFGCDQLVEVEGLFKLEPITDVDMGVLNELGLFDLVSLGSIEMIMFNAVANREKMNPPQVLHECGIISTFLPKSVLTKVPGWFNKTKIGSAISFEVTSLPGHTIRGFNLCVVYGRDDQVFWLHAAGHYARIYNETKGMNWTYSPTYYGIPQDNEDMVWLSSWKFGDQLEEGDRINVSARMPPGFYVKECDIRILYYQEKEGTQSNSKEMSQCSSPWRQNMADRDLSAYQVGLGKTVYFLHHHQFTTPEEILKLSELSIE